MGSGAGILAVPGRARCRIVFACLLWGSGCARLFGWDIHAPGVLSESFSARVPPLAQRVALYFEPALLKYQSMDRGSRFADPQTYHVGESLGPMLLEGFQNGFQEFLLLETEPTAAILKRYGIEYCILVRIKSFENRVTLKGQRLALVTAVAVFDSDLKRLARYEARGASEARGIFRKKGGPEVHLNAVCERNVLGILEYFQDAIRSGGWKEAA